MKIKDKWSDITIAEYERIVETIKGTDDEIERLTGVISVLSGVDEDEIADMPIAEIAKIGQKLDFLNSFDFNKNATYKTLVIDGETLVLSVKDMTVAQYVDFQATWSAETKDLARIISICYVPKGKIYNKDYDIEELIDKIRNNVSIDKANSIGFFLLKRFAKLTNFTARFLGAVTRYRAAKTAQAMTGRKMPMMKRFRYLFGLG